MAGLSAIRQRRFHSRIAFIPRVTMQKTVRQISQQQQRMKSSGDGSHISKDMKGNSETKIKKWLNEQGKQGKQGKKDGEKPPKQDSTNSKKTQKQQNNDICTIL